MRLHINENTSLSELGAIVCEALRKSGIDAFLSGGAVVSIYTENKYQSYDLDFVTIADRRKIHEVMIQLGFDRTKSRLYTHPDTKYAVEFPGAAFLIGDQPINEFAELKLPQGRLKLLTPTDCVKDRLAAYFHWNDRQGLNQAVAVATAHFVNLGEVELWSAREGMKSKFSDFIDLWKETNTMAQANKIKKTSNDSPPKNEDSSTKVHPWRFCPVGKHAVRTHPLHIPPSKAHPDGITTRHFHCAKNPSGKDELNQLEVKAIAQEYFSKLKGPPCPLPLEFDNGSKFDDLIRGWVQYWNEVLNPNEPLDPNLIKALIASESGFNPKSGVEKRARNAAKGLMQINNQAVHTLGDETGEIKNHYVIMTGNDRFDPNMNICGGIRWLFQKQAMASHRLGHNASWDEAVEEYKGQLKDRLSGEKINPKVMGIFREFLKVLMKCAK